MNFQRTIILATLIGGLTTWGNSHAGEASEKAVKLPPVHFSAPGPLRLIYNVEKPLKVNDRAPKTVHVGSRKLKAAPGGAPYETVIEPGDIRDGAIRVTARYYVCEDLPGALCWLRKVDFEIPIDPKAKRVAALELQTPEFPPNPGLSE